MVLIENPGWSADPQQNSLWILELRWCFTCIQRGQKHFTRTGVFSTIDVPRIMALNSCAPSPIPASPIRTKTRMLEKADRRPEWRAEPMQFFHRGQSYFGRSSLTFVRLPTSQKLLSKSVRKIQPSSSAMLGCHHGKQGSWETVTNRSCGPPQFLVHHPHQSPQLLPAASDG